MAADYVDALNYIYGHQVRRRRDPLSVAQRTRSARSFIPAANLGATGSPVPLYAGGSRRNLEEQIQATALGPRGGDIVATPGEAPNVGAAVGYYDRRGKYLGPLYDQFGGKLSMPRGATGIHGTAGGGQGQNYLANQLPAETRQRTFNLGYYGGAGGRETGGVTMGQPLPSVGRFANFDWGFSLPALGKVGGILANSIFPALRAFGQRTSAAVPQRTASSNPYDQYVF